MAECMECAAELNMAADVQVGELVVCEDCGAEFEVMGLEPKESGLLFAPEEVWGE